MEKSCSLMITLGVGNEWELVDVFVGSPDSGDHFFANPACDYVIYFSKLIVLTKYLPVNILSQSISYKLSIINQGYNNHHRGLSDGPILGKILLKPEGVSVLLRTISPNWTLLLSVFCVGIVFWWFPIPLFTVRQLVQQKRG